MVEDAQDLLGFFDSADGFAVDAIYRAADGSEKSIAVIQSGQDQESNIFGGQTMSAASVYLILLQDVATPQAGDSLEISGRSFQVQGVPKLDQTGAIWRVEVAPCD